MIFFIFFFNDTIRKINTTLIKVFDSKRTEDYEEERRRRIKTRLTGSDEIRYKYITLYRHKKNTQRNSTQIKRKRKKQTAHTNEVHD